MSHIKGGKLTYYTVKTRKNNLTEFKYFTDKGEAQRYAQKHKTVVI